MPKHSSRKKPPWDANQLAKAIVDEATRDAPGEGEEEVPTAEGKNPAAVALARPDGNKGGKGRAASLTREQRSEIARKAARARCKKSN